MDICLPELICPEDYDCRAAKLEASLGWLLSKAGVNLRSESGICADECSTLLTPSVMNGLASGHFYYNAMCTLFPKSRQFFDQSQLSTVRWLLRQGFEVLPDEINFEILKKVDPFNQEMHIMLIDKIMAAFIYQTLSLENVVKAVRRFSSFSASSELPTTIEETIAFWSNKVCQSVCEKYQSFLMSGSNTDNKSMNSFYDLLVVSDLDDFAFGRSLACLISFYRPDRMVFEDICLDENSGIADSLYNLQLCADVLSQIFDFPTTTSKSQIMHLTITDVFYNHAHLTINLMALFADLFEYFELTNGSPPPFDSLHRNGPQKIHGQNALPIKIPEISNATKRSFYGSPLNGEKDLSSRTSSLLPLRKDTNQRKEYCKAQSQERDHEEILPCTEHYQSTKMICVDVNENLKNEAYSSSIDDDVDEASTRDSSSIGVSSSSSREVIRNLFSTAYPDTSQSLLSQEAYIARDLMPQNSDKLNGKENNCGEYLMTKNLPSFISKFEPSSRSSFLFPPYRSNDDHITKSMQNNCAVKQLQRDRHTKYCHDLGLISGISKYKKQNTSTIKFDGITRTTEKDVDDEVSAITDVFHATDEEEIAKPLEDFEGHGKNFDQNISLNNSNSNLGKKNMSHAKGGKRDLVECDQEAINHSMKTSWVRQEKLTCMNDETASPIKKESQRMGTFRVIKTHRDGNNDKQHSDNVRKDLSISSPQKTTFSLMSQNQPDSQNGRPKIKTSQCYPLSCSDGKNSPQLTSNLADGKTTWFHSLSNSDTCKGIGNVKDDIDMLQFKSMPPKMGLLKMELIEKRRQIEGKKLSSEMQWSKQRQKVGTEAFIQVFRGNKQERIEDKQLCKESPDVLKKETARKKVTECNHETKVEYLESQSKGGISEKLSNSGVDTKKIDLSISQPSRNLNASGKLKHSSEAYTKHTNETNEMTPAFENNLDAAQTIDHLTHSLSELKGEVKRLSLEQDQLKGFVSISQTPVSKNFKKVKPPQVHQREENNLNQPSKTKSHASPLKFQDSTQFGGVYNKPHIDNDIFQKDMVTSDASSIKNFCYQQLPSYNYPHQLLSDNRLLGIGGTGPSCTPPLYMYSTPQDRRIQRPLSSDSRYAPNQGCLNGMAYRYQNEVVEHPLMALPHPYGSPQNSEHTGYPFHLREVIDNQNGFRHLPSSIAFTIPNEPQNILQHNNILSDWVTASHPPVHPNSFTHDAKVASCPRVGVSMGSLLPYMDPNALHFQDAALGQLNCNIKCPQSPNFAPIHCKENFLDFNQDHAKAQALADKQLIGGGYIEEDQHFIQRGNNRTPEKLDETKDVKKIQGDSNEGSAKISTVNQDCTNINVEDSHGNKSDNNALLSTTDVLNDVERASDEIQPEESKNVEQSLETSGETKRTFVKENPVAFVVQQSSDENVSLEELEKRKLKLEEMHARRREELETKKVKLERDASIKKEMQRQREEQNMMKKAEDRARRDAIYQTYLQKKLENFGEDDAGLKVDQTLAPRIASSNPHLTSSSVKRQKSAKASRHCGTPSGPNEDKDHHNPPPPPPPPDAIASPPLIIQDNRIPLSKVSSASNVLSTGDGEKDVAKEYTGPKLFVKPCHKSNRNIIENALSHCCLAGAVNQDTKIKVLEVLKNSESKHFVILFRDVGMQYRGLYTYDLEAEIINKIQGVGPKTLTNKHIEKFYKYNSGSKNFSEVTSTKHLSATIDAITLCNAVWQRMKASAMAGSKKNLT